MLCEKVSVMVQLVMLLPKTSTAYIVVMLQVLKHHFSSELFPADAYGSSGQLLNYWRPCHFYDSSWFLIFACPNILVIVSIWGYKQVDGRYFSLPDSLCLPFPSSLIV